jgi:hypothetical protein
VRQVIHAGPGRGNGTVIFRGKGERVIDAVGVAVHVERTGRWGKTGRAGKRENKTGRK